MAEKLCFGHEKETVRSFMRRILPEKCGIRLVEVSDSSGVVECLEDPEVLAVVVSEGILTDAHVDVLRGTSKPVVVITDSPAKWAGVKTIPKRFTIEEMVSAVKELLGGAVVAEPTRPTERVEVVETVETREEKSVEVPQSVQETPVQKEEVVEVEGVKEEAKRFQPVSTEEVSTLSREILEREIRHVIREILWDVVPVLAKQILREEIKKILDERLAKKY